MQFFLPNRLPDQINHGFFINLPWFAANYRTIADRHHMLPNNFSSLTDARKQECLDELSLVIDQATNVLNPGEICVILVEWCDIRVRLNAIHIPEDAPLFRQASVMQLYHVEDFFRTHADTE